MIKAKVDFDPKKVKQDVANALNRSLTKSAKAQRNLLAQNLGIKKKHLTAKKKRQITKRAKFDDLKVAIFTSPKFLTPFMFTKAYQPKNTEPFGIATTDSGGKFYSYRHPFKKASKYIPSQINGFNVQTSITTDRGKKRGYSFIQKKSMLDDEALKYKEKLQNDFIDIFAQELNK
ncbi:hypothetical protein [Campylobacter sputorum]|uniref:hypothetical protein n=1 Tax=Campylobacter sputorum TaxID=206 RepID=UPI00053BDEC5|nr:hypothetical protein [Campylobacter sputorum]